MDHVVIQGPYSSGQKRLTDGFNDKSDTIWIQVIKDANIKSGRGGLSHDEGLNKNNFL